jgi:hypothetical protein
MNKTGIAIISGLVGVAAATAVAIIVTAPKAPTETLPETITEQTVTATVTATVPAAAATTADETLPETTTEAAAVLPAPAPADTTTVAVETIPAPAPTTTAAAAVLPAPAPAVTTTQAAVVIPAPAPTTTAPATPEITKEKAEEIALAHAGLAAADVVFSRTEYDREYGANEWEVEFRQGSMEYSYTINAETGAIIEYEVDREDWD